MQAMMGSACVRIPSRTGVGAALNHTESSPEVRTLIPPLLSF
jgi:hypothetical protein